MASVLVIAPHPDDELLGCGGTILRHVAAGDQVHWCIASTMSSDFGFTPERIAARAKEINAVSGAMGFASIVQFNFPATRLDTLPKSDFVAAFKDVFQKTNPEIIYLPHPADIHSDHAATFEAAIACTKWFRFGSVKRVLCYEVLSETDFQVHPSYNHFQPNVYIDITPYLEKKCEALKLYEGEIGAFPFPRSLVAIEALAKLRGAACGSLAAEGFQLVKEIIS